MALKDTVKKWFITNFKPTQVQFYTFFDSIRWKDEKLATSDVDGLDNLLTAKADKAPFAAHLVDINKHVTAQEKANWNEQYSLSPISGSNKVDLLKNGVSVSQIDLTPYLDDSNLARLISGVVDVNGLATFTRDDNSTFTVDFSNLAPDLSNYVDRTSSQTIYGNKVFQGYTTFVGLKSELLSIIPKTFYGHISTYPTIMVDHNHNYWFTYGNNEQFKSFILNNSLLTSNRKFTFPDKDITFAGLDDVSNKSFSITDENDTTKFDVTDKLQFGEGFEFDPISKEIQIKNHIDHLTEINAPIANGTFNLKVRKLDGGNGFLNDYSEKVILLIPFESRSVSSNNKLNGKLTLSKSGGNEWTTIDVAAQSVYNLSYGTLSSTGDDTDHKLVTCDYNGVKWIAVKLKYKENPYNNYWFNGQHITNDLDANGDGLTVQPYYNVNESSIINSEIYNSIQDFVSDGDVKNEFKQKVIAPEFIGKSFKTSDWEIKQVGDDMVMSFGGVIKFRFTSTGEIQAINPIIGTI